MAKRDHEQTLSMNMNPQSLRWTVTHKGRSIKEYDAYMTRLTYHIRGYFHWYESMTLIPAALKPPSRYLMMTLCVPGESTRKPLEDPEMLFR